MKTIDLQIGQLAVHPTKVLFNDFTHPVSGSHGAQIQEQAVV
jgi:hypothetical protein